MITFDEQAFLSMVLSLSPEERDNYIMGRTMDADILHGPQEDGTMYYQGVKMNADSIVAGNAHLTMAWLVSTLRKRGSCVVQFEPGDATRYELLFQNLANVGGQFSGIDPEDYGDWWTVTRIRGGRPTNSIMCRLFDVQFESASLGSGNEWSSMLIPWWIEQMFSIVRSN